ncbi:hypothetical protein H1C71_005303 [Ictidomys tridecemlineatus]|nr:hypothetical protein H1C71_005303 [Ictidomys tridecemlineatus]
MTHRSLSRPLLLLCATPAGSSAAAIREGLAARTPRRAGSWSQHRSLASCLCVLQVAGFPGFREKEASVRGPHRGDSSPSRSYRQKGFSPPDPRRTPVPTFPASCSPQGLAGPEAAGTRRAQLSSGDFLTPSCRHHGALPSPPTGWAVCTHWLGKSYIQSRELGRGRGDWGWNMRNCGI